MENGQTAKSTIFQYFGPSEITFKPLSNLAIRFLNGYLILFLANLLKLTIIK